MREIAALKVAMVGLPPIPATRSRRSCPAACASAPASPGPWRLDPELLFLDEPTAGLDPIGAAHYDELVKGLNQQPRR